MEDDPQLPKKIFVPPTAGEVIYNGERGYRLGSELGAGYFGAVYECWDEWNNELVAKVLEPRNARTYEEVRDDWLRELQLLVGLRHPNITFVHDAFEYRDTFYLTIERCSSTLEGLITMPGLNPALWLPYVARDVLQAVSFLHAAGYVHKDLHPGNVFMLWIRDRMLPEKAPVLQFKVGDLGIARLETDINIFNTRLAKWLLPPEYLDPASFGVIGRSVDIYHVGLLLLGLLLNRVPDFSEEEIIAGQPRLTAEALGSRYSAPLSRALRRHVADRTPTALAFWREIYAAAIAP